MGSPVAPSRARVGRAADGGLAVGPEDGVPIRTRSSHPLGGGPSLAFSTLTPM